MMNRLFLRIRTAILLFVTITTTQFPTSLAVPPGFIDELVAPNEYAMTNTGAFATRNNGDTLLFVGSKLGQVSVLVNPDTNDEPKLLMKLEVCTNGERGLQTILPHPNFTENGYLFIYRTQYREGCELDHGLGPWNRLSRFTVNQDTLSIDESSEMSLFRAPNQNWKNHNGGAMAFGKDGYMYLAIGDGGLAADGHSQNPKTLNGAVLRFTDYGEVPPDNPYVGSGGVRCNETGAVPDNAGNDAKCSEIFALGLRNPFRLAMHPHTSGDKVRFYIGDVGGKAWEEINECGSDFKGANYGWKDREGPCKRDSDQECDYVQGLQDPLYWYAHRRFTSGGAVIAGDFVPEGLWPEEYEGTFVFADYTFGEMYLLVEALEDTCRDCSPPVSRYKNVTFHNANIVVDMFFGPYQDTHALYYLSLFDDYIHRIRFTGSDNRSPNAVIKASPITIAPGDTVHFDATESSDPDGDVLSYLWEFDDGTTSTLANPTHVFTKKGNRHVELTVTDVNGISDIAFETIVVGTPPRVSIDSPRKGTTFAVGDEFILSGRTWYVNGNGHTVNLRDMVWEVRQHHADHYHPFLSPTRGNNLSIDPAPPPEDYIAATNSYLEVILTGKNSDGLSRTVSRTIMPKMVNLTILSEPSHLRVKLDGSLVTTPEQVVSWENHDLYVEVDEMQGNYMFREWSSGANRSHVIRVPAAEGGPISMFTAYFDTIDAPSRAPTTGAPTTLEPIPLVTPLTGCNSTKPCGRCEGHCRHDDECLDGLICFFKDEGEPGVDSVPGCIGTDLSLTDWCMVGVRDESEPIPLVKPVRNDCSAENPCGRCQGRCSSNEDCIGDLVCFQKDAGLPGRDAVPGCIGEDLSKADWCTTLAAIESTDGPTAIPTISPTSAPSPASPFPTVAPTRSPTSTLTPTMPPTSAPATGSDTSAPSGIPTIPPTPTPVASNTLAPTRPPTSPPTANPSGIPTDAPTLSPFVTPSTNPTKSPVIVVDIPLVKPLTGCNSTKPCGRCQGHCRHDGECQEGLICFAKDRGEPGVDSVPGCIGSDLSFTDWCTIGSREVGEPVPLVRPVRKFCNEEEPCRQCQGHCFLDEDCEGDLVCFEKENGVEGQDAVPGCIGEDLSRTNWCTTREARDSWTLWPTMAPMALAPTPWPTSTPSTSPSVTPSDSPSEPITSAPVSNSTTESPSVAPTSTIIPLVKPLTGCNSTHPCGRCEGDCKLDSDCRDGLICFYKDEGLAGEDSVPGCSGTDLSRTDWCIVGVRNEDDPLPLQKPIKKFCSPEEPCGRCHGHCFNDDDCEGNLICFVKDEGWPGVDAVPGCLGEDLSRTNWCTTIRAMQAAYYARRGHSGGGPDVLQTNSRLLRGRADRDEYV